MLRKQKQDSAGKSLNEVESSDAWTKLGIHVPLNPVVKNETSDIIIEKKIQQNEQSPNAPDWELIHRMSKLSEPLEGIPHAPDLELLHEEEYISQELRLLDKTYSLSKFSQRTSYGSLATQD